MNDSPFKKFIHEALTDFEKHLESNRMKETPIDQRMRGARQFALFLVGEPHQYNERTKGSI